MTQRAETIFHHSASLLTASPFVVKISRT